MKKSFTLLKKVNQVDIISDHNSHTSLLVNVKSISKDDSTLILCIDTSGSMGCTYDIKDSEKMMVTRMELISDAILKQLKIIKNLSPTRLASLK